MIIKLRNPDKTRAIINIITWSLILAGSGIILVPIFLFAEPHFRMNFFQNIGLFLTRSSPVTLLIFGGLLALAVGMLISNLRKRRAINPVFNKITFMYDGAILTRCEGGEIFYRYGETDFSFCVQTKIVRSGKHRKEIITGVTLHFKDNESSQQAEHLPRNRKFLYELIDEGKKFARFSYNTTGATSLAGALQKKMNFYERTGHKLFLADKTTVIVTAVIGVLAFVVAGFVWIISLEEIHSGKTVFLFLPLAVAVVGFIILIICARDWRLFKRYGVDKRG